jgi:hypothetical protein
MYFTAFDVIVNGQRVSVEPNEHTFGIANIMFRDSVEYPVEASVWGEWELDDISERLGVLDFAPRGYERNLIEASTAWNGKRQIFDTLTEAVQFVWDNYKPCQHGDGSGTGNPNEYECDYCGTIYTS